MYFFYSGTRTWISKFRQGQNIFSPISPDLRQLKWCFPSYFDYYSAAKDEPRPMPTMPGHCTILDSGAHSFFAMHAIGVEKKRETILIDLEHYFTMYIEHLKLNWNKIDYFVELDVGEVYGMKIVKKMRDDFAREGLIEKCIFAWHPNNGINDLDICLNCPSRYMGIEGMRPGDIVIPYNRILKKAYTIGTRIHGFALTNHKVFRRYPFYSVDSTL